MILNGNGVHVKLAVVLPNEVWVIDHFRRFQTKNLTVASHASVSLYSNSITGHTISNVIETFLDNTQMYQIIVVQLDNFLRVSRFRFDRRIIVAIQAKCVTWSASDAYLASSIFLGLLIIHCPIQLCQGACITS